MFQNSKKPWTQSIQTLAEHISSDSVMLRRKTFTLPQHPIQSDVPLDAQSKKFSVFKGLFLAMLSGVFYSAGAVIVKKMKNIPPGQLAVYRFISIFVFSMPAAVGSQENMFGPEGLRWLLFLRGIFGATNIFLNFIAFRYLPLGEAAVIIFSVPVFVTVAARIYLKEPCGMVQAITVLLTVIGITLTTKIPSKLSFSSTSYSKESLYGMLAAIASLFFSTCRFIVLRKVKNVHHGIIMFNFGWIATIETLILTALSDNFVWHDCMLQGLYIIVLGLLSYIGQVLLTMALQCELAGPVSTMRSASDIILAFMWQTLFFHDTPDMLSISGAILVAFGVTFVGLKKWVSNLPPESSQLKYFNWVNK